jgi:hypothetical protein
LETAQERYPQGTRVRRRPWLVLEWERHPLPQQLASWIWVGRGCHWELRNPGERTETIQSFLKVGLKRGWVGLKVLTRKRKTDRAILKVKAWWMEEH